MELKDSVLVKMNESFALGDDDILRYQVYLKISPMKGVMRFGRKGKLSLRYGGPYDILQRVGEVSY